MTKPVLYYVHFEGTAEFYLCSQKYEIDSDYWEKNNILLKDVWNNTDEATFQTLSNILNQAGITLLRN